MWWHVLMKSGAFFLEIQPVVPFISFYHQVKIDSRRGPWNSWKHLKEPSAVAVVAVITQIGREAEETPVLGNLWLNHLNTVHIWILRSENCMLPSSYGTSNRLLWFLPFPLCSTRGDAWANLSCTLQRASWEARYLAVVQHCWCLQPLWGAKPCPWHFSSNWSSPVNENSL